MSRTTWEGVERVVPDKPHIFPVRLSWGPLLWFWDGIGGTDNDPEYDEIAKFCAHMDHVTEGW